MNLKTSGKKMWFDLLQAYLISLGILTSNSTTRKMERYEQSDNW